MKNSKLKQISIAVLIAITVSVGSYFILLSQPDAEKTDISNELERSEPRSLAERTGVESRRERPDDQSFGWKFPEDTFQPVVGFPEAGSTEDRIAYSTIRDPGGIPQGLPVRLKVPIIGVNSIIEDALITADGRMDVPYGSENVAWFALGPKPGEVGNAVIGGHFGIDNDGTKWVFFDLDKLKIGDLVQILDDRGKILTFQVRRIEMFERDGDATTVFTSDDGLAHLNLITCEGEWNRVDDTYPLRRVVFTTLVSDEEVSGEVAEEVTGTDTTFFRSLSIGDRGVDVAELQTLLVERGFLVIPPGVSKGYFGPLTHTALSRYQTSVGLPSTGVFDFTTRARLAPATVGTDTTFFRSLSIGDRGVDVAELQTLLVERGFLVIPPGVSKGYFGPLTHTALSQYQTSVGLPSTGVFDFTTRARLAPAPAPVATREPPAFKEPAFPDTAITPTQSFFKAVIKNIRSLYATPGDGLITLVLLVLIIFAAFYTFKIKHKKRIKVKQ